MRRGNMVDAVVPGGGWVQMSSPAPRVSIKLGHVAVLAARIRGHIGDLTGVPAMLMGCRHVDCIPAKLRG
jgi:hypothetical protein